MPRNGADSKALVKHLFLVFRRGQPSTLFLNIQFSESYSDLLSQPLQIKEEFRCIFGAGFTKEKVSNSLTIKRLRLYFSGEGGTTTFEIAQSHKVSKCRKINDLSALHSFCGIPRCHKMPQKRQKFVYKIVYMANRVQLQLIKPGHCLFFQFINNLHIRLHCRKIIVSRPFHYHFTWDAKLQGGDNECAPSAMGGEQCPLGEHFFMPDIALEKYNPYRFINAAHLPQDFQVCVHLCI